MAKIVVHPDYDPSTIFQNDVAVLTVEAPVNSLMANPITSTHWPANVTSKSYKEVLALGWGKDSVLYLKKIRVTLAPCQMISNIKITTGLVCTNVTGGKSICQV